MQPIASSAADHTVPRLGRATGVVGASTLVSRLMGYVRDMCVASFFGVGLAADAFLLAFSIPNLLRRLFAEGTLSIAFVPVYADYLIRKGRPEADALAAAAFKLLLALLCLAVTLGIVFAPGIVHLMALGWSHLADKFALCVTLTRIMLPYALFIGATALCMAVLNVLGHFSLPALSPALFNLVMIAVLWFGGRFAADAVQHVQWLAVGVVVGGGLQLALQWPVLHRKGVRLLAHAPLRQPGLKRILRLMGPVFFGAAVYQINSLVIRLLASLLPQGSVAALYYADRLIQFPLGLFGIATATAALPALARQAAQKEWGALQQTFATAIRLVLFIILPAMIGIIVLREPIVRLLFQRGAFDAQATRVTADALLFYGVGLWAFATERIVLNTFYALEDTRSPVRIGIGVMLLHLPLSWLLLHTLQHKGLALALALSSSINVTLLVGALRRRLGALGWRRMAGTAAKAFCCASLMGAIVRWLAGWRLLSSELNGVTAFMHLLLCVVAGIVVYGISAWLWRLPEMAEVIRFFRKKADQG